MMNAPPAKTIMLIDDSSTNNILYESILLDEGYDVIVCEDAKTALKILPQNVPDLIILDLMMPGMDGFQFIKKKNEIKIAAKVPVIMLTARVDTISEQKAYEMGVVEYIIKPVGIAEITEKVKKCLSIIKK